MASKDYREYILPRVADWTRAMRVETGCDSAFMRDNTSINKGRPARGLIDASGINSMPWPANSLDLNPIENVYIMMIYYI